MNEQQITLEQQEELYDALRQLIEEFGYDNVRVSLANLEGN